MLRPRCGCGGDNDVTWVMGRGSWYGGFRSRWWRRWHGRQQQSTTQINRIDACMIHMMLLRGHVLLMLMLMLLMVVVVVVLGLHG